MADDIENDDQWLYGENPEVAEPELHKEPEKKKPESDPSNEDKSPSKVSTKSININ